jgi:hypothetical protein
MFLLLYPPVRRTSLRRVEFKRPEASPKTVVIAFRRYHTPNNKKNLEGVHKNQTPSVTREHQPKKKAKKGFNDAANHMSQTMRNQNTVSIIPQKLCVKLGALSVCPLHATTFACCPFLASWRQQQRRRRLRGGGAGGGGGGGRSYRRLRRNPVQPRNNCLSVSSSYQANLQVSRHQTCCLPFACS